MIYGKTNSPALAGDISKINAQAAQVEKLTERVNMLEDELNETQKMLAFYKRMWEIEADKSLALVRAMALSRTGARA